MPKRKNSLLLAVMLVFILLLLTPLNGGTSKREVSPVKGNAEKRSTDASAQQLDEGERTLSVAVSLDAEQFEVLQQLNEQFEGDSRADVELVNIAPGEVYENLVRQAKLGDTADVMLLNTNWVNIFAVSGFLAPVDSFYTGSDALEPIDVLMNQVKWNGYIWGVPKDIDPYMLVWNTELAEALQLTRLPVTEAEWNAAIERIDKLDHPIQLLEYDRTDGYAVINLLRRWSTASPSLRMLSTVKPHLEGGQDTDSRMWEKLQRGELLAVVTTYSNWQHHRAVDQRMELINQAEMMPYSLQSRSFVISSASDRADLARSWIQYMTSAEAERYYWKQAKVLPALKSIYAVAYADELPAAINDYVMDTHLESAPSTLARHQAVQQLVTAFQHYLTDAISLDALASQWMHTQSLFIKQSNGLNGKSAAESTS